MRSLRERLLTAFGLRESIAAQIDQRVHQSTATFTEEVQQLKSQIELELRDASQRLNGHDQLLARDEQLLARAEQLMDRLEERASRVEERIGHQMRLIAKVAVDREVREGAKWPYWAIDSANPLASVAEENNRNNYYSFSDVDSAPAIHATPLSEYDALLEALIEQGCTFVTGAEVSQSSAEPKRVHIRHDVDGDIVAAAAMARCEADRRVRSTFYVLHTAPYYGRIEYFDEFPVFLRNEAWAPLYQEISELGHEIGLHSDALALWAMEIDGVAGLIEELGWLRSLGLSITGSAPHNSYTVYGADNSAVFEGRPWRLSASAGEPAPKESNRLPLGAISETGLGLAYEANEIFRPEAVQQPITQYSIVNRGTWVRFHQDTRGLSEAERIAHLRWEEGDLMRELQKRHYPTLFRSDADFELTSDQVIRAVANAPTDELSVLAVHPEYFGYRTAPDLGPETGIQVHLSRPPNATTHEG